MEIRFILLISVSILQFCGFVSASTGRLIMLKCSKYGLEENIARVARYLGYDVESAASSTSVISDKCDFQTTLYFKFDSDIVINFDVTDPKDYDSIMEYKGDMISEHYGTINKTLPSCSVNPNQTDVYNRMCKDPGFNAHTKLFIGFFQKHKAIYDVYNAITNNLIEERDTHYDYIKKEIVVCLDSQHSRPSINIEGFLITFKLCHARFECNNNTIAIIAPSPEKLKTCDENIPVIFYDTIYVEPNNVRTIYEEQYTSDFTISTTMIHWNALASSLRKYLDQYKWPRVAIVSDDSLLSHYMTTDQEKYFKDAKTVYTVIQDCTEERDFKEALTLLKNFESRVIIVNVVKHNLNKFIEGAQAAGMTDADIVWVFPGHRQTDIKDFKFKLFVHMTCNLSEVVLFVKDKYQESFGVETNFKEEIKHHRPSEYYKWSETCIVLAKSIPHTLPLMGLANCALQTLNYFHYCADWYVLYLILAIIVFLLLVFAILLFFNHIQMNTLAYKPLQKPPSLWRQLLRKERPPPPRQGFPMRRRY